MLQAGLNRLTDVKIGNCDFGYHQVSDEDIWRVDFIKELVEIKHGDLDLPGLEAEDQQKILEYLCTA